MPVYELTFGFSTSPNYARAVSIANTVPGYRTVGDQRAALHIVPVAAAHAAQLGLLLALASSWRSLSLTIDGVDVGRQRIGALLRVLSCYRDLRLGGLEELHCWGLPGRRARVPCRVIDGLLPWRLEGEYADPMVQPRLVGALIRESMVEACSAFDADAVRQAALEQAATGRERPRGELGGTADGELLERLLRDVDLGDWSGDCRL